jgi:hypothetical protein
MTQNDDDSKMVIGAASSGLRQIYDAALDLTLRLRLFASSPMKARGKQNGKDHLVSRTCAKLTEAEHRSISARTNGQQRFTDQYEMFGRDFLARPPIDNSGRAYTSNAGCLGRSTQGFDNVID